MLINKNNFVYSQFELYWIFLDLSMNPSPSLIGLFKNQKLIDTMAKHFELYTDEIKEDIVWLCSHLIQEDDVELFDMIVKSKIHTNIVEYCFIDTLNEDVLSRSLSFINVAIKQTIEFRYTQKISYYLKIITIAAGFIYYESSYRIQFACVNIVYEISKLSNASIRKHLINSGIVLKLLKLDKYSLSLKKIKEIQNGNEIEEKKCNNFLHVTNCFLVNLLSEYDNDTAKELIEMDILDYLGTIYQLNERNLQKDVILACSNIAVGDCEDVKALINSPLFQIILQDLEPSDKKIKAEIIFLLGNILSSNKSDIIFSFFSYELLDAFMSFLIDFNSDNKIIAILLKNIDELFMTEIKYKFEEAKNFNFDDGKIKFIDHFIKYNGKELLGLLYQLNLPNEIQNFLESVNNKINNYEYRLGEI